VAQDLDRQMGRRTEAEERHALAGLDLGPAQRAVADRARAQQRRRGDVVELIGQMNREVLGDGDRLGVTTVHRPTRELGVLAEVLVAAPAVSAHAVGPVQPAHADAFGGMQPRAAFAQRVHHADDLMPGHDRQPRQVELPGDDVQIGAAAGAHADLQANLARPRIGRVAIDELERRGANRSGTLQHLRLHLVLLTAPRTWPNP
jgi:hypothetical protein